MSSKQVSSKVSPVTFTDQPRNKILIENIQKKREKNINLLKINLIFI